MWFHVEKNFYNIIVHSNHILLLRSELHAYFWAAKPASRWLLYSIIISIDHDHLCSDSQILLINFISHARIPRLRSISKTPSMTMNWKIPRRPMNNPLKEILNELCTTTALQWNPLNKGRVGNSINSAILSFKVVIPNNNYYTVK